MSGKEHDAFCDAAHLDGEHLPVAQVLHPETGAPRVILPGRITVYNVCISNNASNARHVLSYTYFWHAQWDVRKAKRCPGGTVYAMQPGNKRS